MSKYVSSVREGTELGLFTMATYVVLARGPATTVGKSILVKPSPRSIWRACLGNLDVVVPIAGRECVPSTVPILIHGKQLIPREIQRSGD